MTRQMTDEEFNQFINDYNNKKPEAMEIAESNASPETVANDLENSISKVSHVSPDLAKELERKAKAYQSSQERRSQAQQQAKKEVEGYKSMEEIQELHDPLERGKLIRKYHLTDNTNIKEQAENERYSNMSMEELQKQVPDAVERVRLIRKYNIGGAK